MRRLRIGFFVLAALASFILLQVLAGSVETSPFFYTISFNQVSFTADHSGPVPCSNYGYVELYVAPDPVAVEYVQVSADLPSLPTGSPAWIVRNLPVLSAKAYETSSIQTSAYVDLTQLGVAGDCIDGDSIDFDVILTKSPIDTAPSFSSTFATTVGPQRTDNAEGDVPVAPVSPGSLAPSAPPPAFAFVPGPITLVGRKGMGNLEQARNECGPAAVANSMHWLKATGSINLGGDTPAQSLGKLNSDMNRAPGAGIGQKAAIEGKIKFAQRAEHPLNLNIHYQADAGLTDLGANVTVGGTTVNRDGAGGPPTFAYLKQQMQAGQDVELSIDWLNAAGGKTGGHVIVVSGLVEIGNFRGILFNDDTNQGNAGGLRTNNWAKIEAEGAYMKLGGLARNRVKAIYVESPPAPPPKQGTYEVLITVLQNETTPGFAGIYFNCLADIQQTGTAKTDGDQQARAYCYTDSFLNQVNSLDSPGVTGDGLPGRPPPFGAIPAVGPPETDCARGLHGTGSLDEDNDGVINDGCPSEGFGDVDSKHTALAGFYNNADGSTRLRGCFEDEDASQSLGNMYWEAVMIITPGGIGTGTVDIWTNQTLATCTATYAWGAYATGSGEGPPVGNFDDAALLWGQQSDNKDYDSDGDGLPDAVELRDETGGGGNLSNCGGRDPFNPYDWYDVNSDGVIDLINDILGVIDHWQPTAGGAPPYDIIYDRPGTMTGALGHWNRGAPDGVIDLINDILGVIDQWHPTPC